MTNKDTFGFLGKNIQYYPISFPIQIFYSEQLPHISSCPYMLYSFFTHYLCHKIESFT